MTTPGRKNELASLIGNFNPAWDAEDGTDEAFFQAVSVPGDPGKTNLSAVAEIERADRPGGGDPGGTGAGLSKLEKSPRRIDRF